MTRPTWAVSEISNPSIIIISYLIPREPERSKNISPAVFATQLPENHRTKSLIPAGPIEPRTSSLIVEALTYPWGSLLLFRWALKREESYEGPIQQRKTRVELPELGSKAGEFRSIHGPCFFLPLPPPLSKHFFFLAWRKRSLWYSLVGTTILTRRES